MEINTAPAFDRKYRRLERRIREKAKEKEEIFRTDPYHPSLDTHKLHGKEKHLNAFSVDRKYRIKFLFISPQHILFVDIGTHDIYR